MKHTFLVALLSLAAVAQGAKVALLAQSPVAPINDAPNPYRTVQNFFKLPDGRTWAR